MINSLEAGQASRAEPQTVSKPKGFLVFRIHDEKIEMGHHTGNQWKQTWSKPLRQTAAALP